MSGVNRDILEKVEPIRESYSIWEWRLITAGAGLALFQWLIPFQYNLSQAGPVLGTLATAQASVLAIVFSVSLLGVQLIANRYSSRMVTLVTSSPVFQGTLLLLFISVAIDLILLFQLPVLSSEAATAGILIAFGVAGASGVALKRYVETTLERSTPEGLLEAYENSITLDGFREDVREASNTNSLHPLHDLHELVMSALGRHEWSTASNGIRYTKRICVRIIEDEADDSRNNLISGEDELSNNYFKEPLDDFFPRIVSSAVRNNEIDQARQAITAIVEIGKSGIKNERAFIATQVSGGLTRIFQDSRETDDEPEILVECIEAYQDLYGELLEQGMVSYTGSIISRQESRIRVWLLRDYESRQYERILGKVFKTELGPGLGSYLEVNGDALSGPDVEWSPQSGGGSRDRVGVVYQIIDSAAGISLNIFRYIDRNEEWPIVMTSLRDGWLELCKSSAKKGTDGIATMLIQYYICVGYLVYRFDVEKSQAWANPLARFKTEFDDGQLVNDAIRNCSKDGLTPQFKTYNTHLNNRQEPDSDAKKFYKKVTARDDDNFEDWLESFAQNVHNVYEEYHSD